jgi:hypothetical protein
MSSMSAAPRSRQPIEEPPHVELAGHYIRAALRVAPTNQPTVFARYIAAAARQLGITA